MEDFLKYLTMKTVKTGMEDGPFPISSTMTGKVTASTAQGTMDTYADQAFR